MQQKQIFITKKNVSSLNYIRCNIIIKDRVSNLSLFVIKVKGEGLFVFFDDILAFFRVKNIMMAKSSWFNQHLKTTLLTTFCYLKKEKWGKTVKIGSSKTIKIELDTSTIL